MTETNNDNNCLIGYSALNIYNDCYEYNENSCYIADSPQSLRNFIAGAMMPTENYRITPVELSDMLSDFGCSGGEYALEAEALERFEKAAKSYRNSIYTVNEYEYDVEPKLFIVHLQKPENLLSKLQEKYDLPVLSELKDLATQVTEGCQSQRNERERLKKETIFIILKDIEFYDGVYKRESVNNALELKEDITPHLIGILNNILKNPSEYLDKENYFAHIYAFILLGHFKESRAHKTIVDLFSLPGDIPMRLFGGFVTKCLPIVLLRTCGGSMDLIKSLVLNKEVYDYCRTSAMETMVMAVAEGIVTREEVLSFFGGLFTGQETKENSDFWGLLANSVCDLYPEELMGTIKKAYQDGLINPGNISYGEFEETIETGKEKCLSGIKEILDRASLDDVHAYMSKWSCFNREESVSAPPPPDFTVKPKKKTSENKAQKKKKKKMAKASRKKNRR